MEAGAPVLWAKSTTPAGEWQPLWTHLVDVGVVARWLLMEWMTAAARREVSRGLGLDEEDAVSWTSAFAALHDLGKATPQFQRLSHDDATRVARRGLTVGVKSGFAQRHDLLTGVVLPEAIVNSSIPASLVPKLVRLLVGHHGRFEDPVLYPETRAQAVIGNSTWGAIREYLASRTLSALHVPLERPPRERGRRVSWTIGSRFACSD